GPVIDRLAAAEHSGGQGIVLVADLGHARDAQRAGAVGSADAERIGVAQRPGAVRQGREHHRARYAEGVLVALIGGANPQAAAGVAQAYTVHGLVAVGGRRRIIVRRVEVGYIVEVQPNGAEGVAVGDGVTHTQVEVGFATEGVAV